MNHYVCMEEQVEQVNLEIIFLLVLSFGVLNILVVRHTAEPNEAQTLKNGMLFSKGRQTVGCTDQKPAQRDYKSYPVWTVVFELLLLKHLGRNRQRDLPN